MIRIILGVIVTLIVSTGSGLCSDPQEVDTLLRQARSGDTRAMCDLGVRYYKGDGVLKDPFKAKCWVKKAHDLGDRRAEKIWKKYELWTYSGKCNLEFDDRPASEYRSGDRYTDPVTGMTMIWIPGRCFKMGCEKNEKEDCGKNEPEPRRICPDGFWMGQYEVTQKAWLTLMDRNPSRFTGDELPVEQVSFYDVREFIRRLNRETGLRYALPTEAQWEFACRNRGRRAVYPWGMEDFQPDANCSGCDAGSFRGRTAPVGSFEPNPAGIYDMGGNVREWCRDTYDRSDLKKGKQDGKRRKKKSKNPSRVVRGGSFVDPVSRSRCRARSDSLPGMTSYFTGFRLVLEDLE